MRRTHAVILLLAIACSRATPAGPVADPVADRPALRAADSAWNQSSLAKVPDRMAEHYAPNAVADFGAEPVRGRPAIREMWAQSYADTTYRTDWAMERAEIVPGTLLGYTIGRWRQHSATSDATGTYVAVWQKQQDGRWLVLLDTGRPDHPAVAVR